MATQGWGGYGFDGRQLQQLGPSPAAAKKRRKGVNELVLEQLGTTLERDLETWTEALLTAAMAEGGCRAWFHLPDTSSKKRGTSGFLDLAIVPRTGLPIALELKRTDGLGRVSPEQQVWLESWGERGAVASSQAEVLDFLRRWGVVA
jgi:hypothetical protein